MTMNDVSPDDEWCVVRTYSDAISAKTAWLNIVSIGIPCTISEAPIPDGVYFVRVPGDCLNEAQKATEPYLGSEAELTDEALSEPFEDGSAEASGKAGKAAV